MLSGRNLSMVEEIEVTLSPAVATPPTTRPRAAAGARPSHSPSPFTAHRSPPPPHNCAAFAPLLFPPVQLVTR
jgi:hypothetical protein